jgi:hypothetical protein
MTLVDGADPNAPLDQLADGNFLLQDLTRAVDGSGQILSIIAPEENMLRQYQAHVRRVRRFNDVIPEEGTARMAHVHRFRLEVAGLVVQWGDGAVPDDVRWALHDFERVGLGLAEGQLTRFGGADRGGLVRVSRMNHADLQPVWIRVIFGPYGNGNGGNDGNGPGAGAGVAAAA